MNITTVLLSAMSCLAIISLYLQMKSRVEVRRLRATVDLMKANQTSIDTITQSKLLRQQLEREVDVLNNVVVQLHKRNSQDPVAG